MYIYRHILYIIILHIYIYNFEKLFPLLNN